MATKIRHVDFSPDEWLSGAAVLKPAERGCYITICALIYSYGEPIADDPGDLAKLCNITREAWARVRDSLIRRNKIFLTDDGRISQSRCEIELDRARNRTENAKEIGRKGGVASGISRKSSTISHENQCAEDKENNNITEADASASSKLTINYQPSTRERDTNVSLSKKARTAAPKKPLALDDEMLAWIAENCPGIDPAYELRKHLDWKASKGRTYRDDRAAFRNWCSNSQERTNNRGGHGPARKTPLESLYGGAALAIERREAQRQADRGAGDDAAQPLLDGGGGRTLEGAANLRLVG